MKIKLILFDLDGVLIRSWRFIMGSYGHVLAHFDLPTEGLSHPKMRHCTMHQAHEHLGISEERFDEAAALHAEFQQSNLHLLELFPASMSVLQTLKSRFQIGVVSNRYKNSVNLLRHCNMLDYIELIVGAEDVEHPKPSPEGILVAMNYFNTEPENTLMIGDMPSDIQAGKSAGAWTAGINTADCLEALKKANPDFLIHDLGELISILTTD